MESDNFLAACIACIVVGGEKYALSEVGGELQMPIGIFMHGGIEKWPEETFKKTLDELVTDSDDAVIAALESILIGSSNDREVFKLATAKMSAEDSKTFRKEWNDKYRSSMNDIGARALEIARVMRLSKKGANDG